MSKRIKGHVVHKVPEEKQWEHLMDGNEWLMTDNIVKSNGSFMKKLEKMATIESEYKRNKAEAEASKAKAEAKRAAKENNINISRAASIGLTSLYMLGGVLA